MPLRFNFCTTLPKMRNISSHELHYHVPTSEAFDLLLGQIWPDTMFVNFDGINARLESAKIEAVVRISNTADEANQQLDLELRMPKNRLELMHICRKTSQGKIAVETIGRDTKKKKIARAVNHSLKLTPAITASEELTLCYGIRDNSGRTKILTLRPVRSFTIASMSGATSDPAGYSIVLLADSHNEIDGLLSSKFLAAVLDEANCVPMSRLEAAKPIIPCRSCEHKKTYDEIENLYKTARSLCHESPEL